MTLVIGRALSDIGFLVADTMLSVAFELKDHKGPVNGKFHALKIQIIDSNTAVAFSGDVEGSFELREPVCTENPIRIDCVIESPKRPRR
jgi:hypothetical protein